MLLIDSRHTPADLRRWEICARAAEAQTKTIAHQKRLDEASRALDEFGGGGYCGVSWGKDSIAVAHLVRQHAPTVPLVWVRVHRWANPDCPAVRDAFMKAHPGPYDEVDVKATATSSKLMGAAQLEQDGFAEAGRRHGRRYRSGVRAAESTARRMACAKNGAASANTCRPLAWWSGLDVFGYAMLHGLPLHHAYGFTLGGLLDPVNIRVASLGGSRGAGMGRHQWERKYYGRALALATAAAALPTPRP